MKLKTLLKTSYPWLEQQGEDDSILIATLGRLSRALSGHVFPGWSDFDSRQAAADELRPSIKNLAGFKTAFHADMADLSHHDRTLLLERKLISPCMAARGDGSEIFIPKAQNVSIMLNEEEHFVIHSFACGAASDSLRTKMENIAQQLEETHRFARGHEGDYLSSIPAECGNGLQMYFVMHLPGLVISNLLKEIRIAFEKLDLQISPFYSDGSQDTSDLFVIYTTPKRGDESDVDLNKLQRVARTLIRRERQVRAKLIHLRPLDLRDQVSRALGRLLYATTLSFTEMANAISLLMLGIDYGFVTCAEWDAVHLSRLLRKLIIDHAPAHLAQRRALHVGDVDSKNMMALRAQSIQTEFAELNLKMNPIDPFLSHQTYE